MGQASDSVKQAAGEAAQSGFEAAKDATMSAADAATKSVAEADLGGHASRMTQNMADKLKEAADDVVTARFQSFPKPQHLKEIHHERFGPDQEANFTNRIGTTGSPKNLKDQMADAGASCKQRADEAFRASTDIARDKFKEAADAAKDMASGTVDQIQGQAREQQRSGADFIERFAGNIREAARAFENDVPFAARGINSAAEYVEDAAEKIRNGSFRDLVDNATDFAKRQPAAFLGVSVLAGFAAVRFLKASGGDSPSSPTLRYGQWNVIYAGRRDGAEPHLPPSRQLSRAHRGPATSGSKRHPSQRGSVS